MNIITHNIYAFDRKQINSILNLYDKLEFPGTLIIYSNKFDTFLTNLTNAGQQYPKLKLMSEDDFNQNHDILEYVYTIGFISFENSEPLNATQERINQIWKYYGNESLPGIGRTTNLIEKVSDKDCVYFCRDSQHATSLAKKYQGSNIEFNPISIISRYPGLRKEIFVDHAVRLTQDQYDLYLELNFKAQALKSNNTNIEQNKDCEYFKIENSNYIFYIHADILHHFKLIYGDRSVYELRDISECVYDKELNKIIKYRNLNQQMQMLDDYYGISK